MHKISRKFHNLFRRIKVMKNWYQFMWPLTQVGSWPRVAELRSGGKIMIKAFRSSDYAIFNEVAIDDVYHIEEFNNPKRIIDLGANIGVFTIVVAKKFPNATVFAFEPEKKNFERLTRNVEASGAKNVVLVNKAVTSKEGTATLHLSIENNGAHNLYRELYEEKGETQTVQTVTLKEFLPANVIKVDVEGAEYEIFNDLVPDCDFIVMELHYGDNDKLLKQLETKFNIAVYHPTAGPIHILRRK